MSTWTIYSQPGCNPCRLTRKLLDENPLATYTDIPLESVGSQTRQQFRALGFTTAPVVIAPNGDMWSGYRPDLIKKHLN